MSDPKELMKRVSFMVMGDGGVYRGGKEHYFAMNMLKKNIDYVEYCRNTLSEITNATVYERTIRPETDGFLRQDQVRLQTSSHPYFSRIRERVYVDSYKGLDPHAMKLLDPEALAILYMCDGSCYTKKAGVSRLVNNSYSVSLNMKRLSYGDQLFLKRALRDKLGLEWNVNKHGSYWYLRLRTKDIPAFSAMIEPFIFDSFRYKLPWLRSSPEDREIVCSVQECAEVDGNDQPLLARAE